MRAVHPVRLNVREKETVTENDKQTEMQVNRAIMQAAQGVITRFL